MSYLIALMTAPSRDQARTLARTLVEERLAACCNIIDGVESIYRWEGTVEEGREVLLVIKTTAERFEEMKERALALHPYDLPELVALPVVAGSPAYLGWITGSVERG
jgi:periplasmic divalent cation tolerance protein